MIRDANASLIFGEGNVFFLILKSNLEREVCFLVFKNDLEREMWRASPPKNF